MSAIKEHAMTIFYPMEQKVLQSFGRLVETMIHCVKKNAKL